MCDIDIDITQRRPLRLGLALGDHIDWEGEDAAERIRGVDLSDVARKSTRLRRERPDSDVVADIEVVIAAEASSARAMISPGCGESSSSTMIYVGTPAGLVGLIVDMHALGITDGVVLIPKAPGVADLIREAVLPLLYDMTQLPETAPKARTA